MRPKDIEQVLPTLEALATSGGASLSGEHGAWLRSVGAAVESGTGWAVPTTAWLEAAVPARDRLDLLRRTAIRDSGYRGHLDLSVGAVLYSIGVAERWRRFEELVLGPFLPFSPRFVQLLEWLERWKGQPCVAFDDGIWREAETQLDEVDSQTFAVWDQKLWGFGGNPSTLFPLLQDQYVALIEHPVHLCLEFIKIDQPTETLLRSLVDASSKGEGVDVSSGQQDAIDALLRLGVPVRVQPGTGTQAIGSLVGAVSLSARAEPRSEYFPSSSRSVGVPEAARHSSVRDSERQSAELVRTFWECAEGTGHDGIAFLSVSDHLQGWPEQQSEAPPWAHLPVAESLRNTSRARRDSPEADEALLTLSHHLLFGFLLQVLLVEALDRELGEETLVLAPPTDRRVDDIEGATHVFYRPRRLVASDGSSSQPESYELGTLDDVFSELARAVGIVSIFHAYQGSDLGPWSRALRLSRSAELVVGLHDRWSIAPHVLDRLHGGGMMTAVIRRGRQFRERIHSELHQMWTARRTAASAQEVRHG